MPNHRSSGVRSEPLDVYITTDVEVWCDGWERIDAKFPSCFRQYIHGTTPDGDFGVAYQARMLQLHGLQGTFFVEPLFSLRFGADPLSEIVDLIRRHGQDVQLHLHPEWVDEALQPPLPVSQGKRQFMRNYDEREQAVLLGLGRTLLIDAGAKEPVCFRAGGFGFDHRTLAALESIGMLMDASYNAAQLGPSSGVHPGRMLTDRLQIGRIAEFPMTVFRDGMGRLRHAQLTACSWRELESLMWQALASGQKAVVLLSHGSELLNASRTRADRTVVRRFENLCRFLENHASHFRTRAFDCGPPELANLQPPPLKSSMLDTANRVAQQLWRRTQSQ
jgi:hypothetical protein